MPDLNEEIFISNSIKQKCPLCHTVLGIKNDKESVYRNISLIHLKKDNGIVVKCRRCKNLVDII